MGSDTDDAIMNLIAEKVKAQLSIVMKENEIKELVIEELAQFQMEESSQRRKLKEWVKEDLHKRIRQMISQELTNPEYVGTTWGDAGSFWKQIIKENADNLVAAMFARVLDEAKNNLANYFAEQMRRSY